MDKIILEELNYKILNLEECEYLYERFGVTININDGKIVGKEI
jgi:hypothetical protein